MSKTLRKREPKELSLSKNYGSSIRYLKRKVEEEETQEELERAIREFEDDNQRPEFYDFNR
jgi:hypothetical protein